ncbi:hypothetical protein ES705_30342 [subsurface metagenome]
MWGIVRGWIRLGLEKIGKGSCECFWGKKLDLALVNNRFCVACGRVKNYSSSSDRILDFGGGE